MENIDTATADAYTELILIPGKITDALQIWINFVDGMDKSQVVSIETKFWRAEEQLYNCYYRAIAWYVIYRGDENLIWKFIELDYFSFLLSYVQHKDKLVYTEFSHFSIWIKTIFEGWKVFLRNKMIG